MGGVLWRSPDWMKFWVGQSVSLLGSQFTLLALPLTAVVVLHAAPAEMGILVAAEFLPGLLFGLVAGVWLDRTRRKPVLVAASCVSAVVLATVPLAALLHVLRMEQLYAVAFLTGVAYTFFSVAQNAIVPTLAGREHLVEANSKIQTSRTVAQLAGPGLAGVVVQAVTAPIAIAVDAFSFLVGGLTAAWIRVPETAPERKPGRELLAEAREGTVIIWNQPLVRSITLTIVAANSGGTLSGVVWVLLFVGHLGLTPAQLGLSFAASSLSALIGAQVARPLVTRFGVGPVMVAGASLIAFGQLIVIVAALGPRNALFPVLVAASLVSGFGLMAYNINQQAIRQAVIPNRLLGRATAAILLVVAIANLLAAVIGGSVGQRLGLYPALFMGIGISMLSVLPAVFSPLRSLREIPAAA